MAADTTPRRTLRLKRPSPNPILIKELRSRMRGPRAFLILTGFLVLLSGVAVLFYKMVEQATQFSGGPTPVSVTIGVTMFLGLAFVELFLVAFITPALTAGTISGEREALTFEMLMATPLRPISVLLGKMVAALSYVFLLIFAAVPLLSIVYIFGGVTVRDMLVAFLILVVTAVSFGTVGIFWSALLGRTGRATVLSYLTLLTFIGGPLLAGISWSLFQQGRTPPPGFSYLNPFVAVASILTGPAQGFGFFGGPLYTIMALLTGGDGMTPPTLAHPAWHWTLAAYTLLTLVLGMASIILVRPAGRRRVKVPQALFAIVILLVYFGVASLIFRPSDWKQIWSSPSAPQPMFKGHPLPAGPPHAGVEWLKIEQL